MKLPGDPTGIAGMEALIKWVYEAPRHVSNGVVRQIWVSSIDCAGQATQLDLWASCAERDTKVGELIGVFSARIAAYNGSPQKIRTFPGTAILFNDDLKTVVSQATYDLANDLDPDSIVGVADVQKRAPRRRVADREMLISYYVRHGGKSKKDATVVISTSTCALPVAAIQVQLVQCCTIAGLRAC